MVWNVDISTHQKANHWSSWVKSEKKLQANRPTSPQSYYQAPLPKPGDFLTSSSKGLTVVLPFFPSSPGALSEAGTPRGRGTSPRSPERAMSPAYAAAPSSEDMKLFSKYRRDPFIRAMSPSHEEQLAKSRHAAPTSPRGVAGMVNDTCGFRPYCGGEAGGGMHMYAQTSFKETLYMLPGRQLPPPVDYSRAFSKSRLDPLQMLQHVAPVAIAQVERMLTPGERSEAGGYYSPHIPTANPSTYWTREPSLRKINSPLGASHSASLTSLSKLKVRGGAFTQGGGA
eukprot:CAMPEP_0179421098 /NCGR_PEP_ID=MMETSP0799-20121207/9564_1 /TAXON_ID=46947 /ORGANISM="Geminigera cryophila, Strain CCMP2564" /LENGTH=283 /DNA_ID=CAMNT_0021194841 /DNA_START=78 /DNA_END=925 /DNA_ORIENTATION=-